MARKTSQKKYLDLIGTTYPAMNKTIVPLFADEIIGIERLAQMGVRLFNTEQLKNSNYSLNYYGTFSKYSDS
jgi:anion-transporting  ArsA/GET3 family ATPase